MGVSINYVQKIFGIFDPLILILSTVCPQNWAIFASPCADVVNGSPLRVHVSKIAKGIMKGEIMLH